MFKHYNLLPRYPDNAKKGTKRLYLFLSGFFMLFVLSALTVSGLSSYIIGSELTGTLSNVMMPSFILFSIVAFFQRKEMRKSPYQDSYKAMTRMIKHQWIGVFVLTVLLAYYFESLSVIDSANKETASVPTSASISVITVTFGSVILYLYGLCGILHACWLYRKHIIK